MRWVCLVCCLALFVLLAHGQDNSPPKRKLLMAPYVPPSQSPSPTPRPARTDYVDLTFTTEDDFVPDRFDDFATSFFEYFGLTSLLDASTRNYYELDDNGDGNRSTFDFNENNGASTQSYSVMLSVTLLLLIAFALV